MRGPITDVLGGTISYAYSGHLLTQGTDAKGHVFVRNTYDASGRVTTQLDVNGGTTTIAYDTPGAGATRVTDQRGKETTYYGLWFEDETTARRDRFRRAFTAEIERLKQFLGTEKVDASAIQSPLQKLPKT